MPIHRWESSSLKEVVKDIDCISKGISNYHTIKATKNHKKNTSTLKFQKNHIKNQKINSSTDMLTIFLLFIAWRNILTSC